MKIVFMGTPDYAAVSLQALIDGGYEITGVVTQPDRPKGRSGAPVYSPVKETALAAGIPVFQPERIKRPEAVEQLRAFPADLFVVAAFGQILSREILEMPMYGCINIHASLLPKYRGASPIQRVILDGEEKSGVTIMQMDEGIDTGDILYQKELLLDPEETFESLHDRLAILGGEAITEALSLLEKGELQPVPQGEEGACYAKLISKEDGRMEFDRRAAQLHAQVRAMNPWPGAYCHLGDKMLKIWKARPAEASPEAGQEAQGPGTVLQADHGRILVSTGEGALELLELQLEGKKRMSVTDFLNGGRLKTGDHLE